MGTVTKKTPGYYVSAKYAFDTYYAFHFPHYACLCYECSAIEKILTVLLENSNILQVCFTPTVLLENLINVLYTDCSI